MAERIRTHAHQGAALLLSPIILMVGMALITAIHEAFANIVTGSMGTGALFSIMIFLVHLGSLVLFGGLIWFLYEFVKRAGWGLFH